MIPGSATPLLLAQSGDDGYKIDRSLRFNRPDSGHLSKAIASAGNKTTATLSCWVKRSLLSTPQYIYGSTSAQTTIVFKSGSDQLQGNTRGIGGTNYTWITSAVFRDTSAWYHVVVAWDSTQVTSTNRVKVYVNGVLQALSTVQYCPQNTTLFTNDTRKIGNHESGSNYFGGYLADVHFIDGQALAPTDFGEYDDNNVWQAKKVSITSPNDGTVWSSALTSSDNFYTGAQGVQSGFDADTSTYVQNQSSASAPNSITFTPSGGITHASSVEVYLVNNQNTVSYNGGSAQTLSANAWRTVASGSGTLTSLVFERNSTSGASFAAIRVDGVILVDGANEFGTNGFHLDFSDNSSNSALGYDAAVTQPTLNPKGGFDVVTYTGNGASTAGGSGSTQNIDNLAFEPGLVWIKDRTTSGHNNNLIDVINEPPNLLMSDTTNALITDSTDGVTSFNSNGFSLGANSVGTQSLEINKNGNSYVAWCWKAGGTPSSNTDGSITSQVSASDEYGFSVVKWTGQSSGSATVGHGLSTAPKWIIVKALTGTVGWTVGHESIGWTKRLQLNTTAAESTSSNYWNDTAPTSSVFTSGANNTNNTFIAYCWSEVAGFSKFGSYTGNGNSNGPVVTTGFKPRYLMVKRTDANNNWTIFDSARNLDNDLKANTSETEGSAPMAFLNDGFQPNNTYTNTNANGATYIYAAFADRPGNNWDVNNLVAEAAGLSTANQGFDAVTYSGSGSTNAISLRFQPDLVWIKRRNGANAHALFDSIRGVTKVLESSNTGAEKTNDPAITSFDTNGFTVGGTYGQTNASGGTYVAWCWKAGGTAVSNTDGTITSQVSANTTYGFSVVKYNLTGTSAETIGHGLNSSLGLLITKCVSTTNGWAIWHSAFTDTQGIAFNTSAVGTQTWWDQSNMTSSVFAHKGGTTSPSSGADVIAYCWSEVPGFSKFGSFTGYGVSGNTVTTGFKPRFLIIKRTDSTGNWWIWDTERGNNKFLYADASSGGNANDAVVGSYPINATATGFSIDNTADLNTNGATYIYAAFADRPPGEIIDSLIDTPTDYEATPNNGGNYATLNPLNKHNTADTFSEGNLKLTSSGSGSAHIGRSTIAMSSGKYYWEVTWDDTSQNFAGIQGQSDINYNNSYVYLSNAKASANNGSSEGSSYGASWETGDVIGIAYDADNRTLTFYKNGLSQGTAFTNITGTYSPYPSGYVAFFGNWSGQACTFNVNFGQRPFAFPPGGAGGPSSDFKSLCTTNLPDPTIADGSTAFDAVTWSGTGSSQTISLGFDPDLIWSKTRNYAVDHKLVDSVRGFTKQLEPNQTVAEYTHSTGVTGTSSTGFTIGTGNDWNNPSSRTYVGWAWDGGSSNTTISTGGLNSSVYDQSQNWTSLLTSSAGTISNASNSFDGSTSTTSQLSGTSAGSYIQFGVTLNNVTKLEIYQRTNSDISGAGIQTYNNAPAAQWVELTLTSSTVSNIRLEKNNNDPGIYAIRVNGALLVDSSATPPNVPTIASTVRANPSAGFSIVSYQGNGLANQTVGHSLNAKPSLVIYKNRDSTSGWRVIPTFINDKHYLALNNNIAIYSSATSYFGNITSSVLGVSGSNVPNINSNGDTHIAYCFAPVEGYSAFGKYTGNGSSDGPFVLTGFKVAFLLTKRVDSVENWEIRDSTRNPYNTTNLTLFPHSSGAEDTGSVNFDFLSNGFKVRNNNGSSNANGGTYIYAAFAEHPFKTARAR